MLPVFVRVFMIGTFSGISASRSLLVIFRMSSISATTFTTPLGKTVQTGDLVTVYKDVNKYPLINGLIFNSTGPASWGVRISSKVRNCDVMEIETLQQSVSITKSGDSLKV